MRKLPAYLKLMRFDRPIGTVLLLWPVLWGLWLASNGFPTLRLLFIFVFGAVVTRAMGCVMNDIADRKFDPHVERTKTRPLAAGDVSLKEALIILFFLAVIALCLVLMLNSFSLLLAVIAAFIIAIYPFVKRFFNGPQFVLGIVFGGFPILIAFAAVQNQLPRVAWLLSAASCCWTVAYDTMYAMSDKEDDRKIGVKSTAFLFGRFVTPWILFFQLIMMLLLICVGRLLQLNIVYYVALFAAALLFVFQLYLIKGYNRQRCLSAFLNNKWVGALILIGLVLGSGTN